MNRYVCLCCDSKKGHETLRRIRPHKIYVCTSCVKERGGLENIQQHLPMLMEKFRERRDKTVEVKEVAT